MKTGMVRTRVVLAVEVSREDWHRENPGESDSHIREFIRENARLAVEAHTIPKEFRHTVKEGKR